MIIFLIQGLHLILVISLAMSIFITNTQFKILCITLLIFMLFHYITNYGKCGLTQLEYLIMGEKYQEGFLYRLIKPVITIPEQYFDKNIFYIHIIYIIILFYQINC
jgi:hypothetical protein